MEPEHAESYRKLQKAIKQRNRAIKNGDTINVVKTWDKTISKEGEKITENRKSFIEELQVELSLIQKEISKR